MPPIDLSPIDLQEAALDQASGLFGDLDAGEILLEYAQIQNPPYLVAADLGIFQQEIGRAHV